MSKRTRNPLMLMNNETWHDIARKYYYAFNKAEEDYEKLKELVCGVCIVAVLGILCTGFLY